jgi:hypothetical protein
MRERKRVREREGERAEKSKRRELRQMNLPGRGSAMPVEGTHREVVEGGGTQIGSLKGKRPRGLRGVTETERGRMETGDWLM